MVLSVLKQLLAADDAKPTEQMYNIKYTKKAITQLSNREFYFPFSKDFIRTIQEVNLGPIKTAILFLTLTDFDNQLPSK